MAASKRYRRKSGYDPQADHRDRRVVDGESEGVVDVQVRIHVGPPGNQVRVGAVQGARLDQVGDHGPDLRRQGKAVASRKLRWSHIVGQVGGQVKVYSGA